MFLGVAIGTPTQAGSVYWVLTKEKGPSLLPQKMCFSALSGPLSQAPSVLVMHTMPVARAGQQCAWAGRSLHSAQAPPPVFVDGTEASLLRGTVWAEATGGRPPC